MDGFSLVQKKEKKKRQRNTPGKGFSEFLLYTNLELLKYKSVYLISTGTTSKRKKSSDGGMRGPGVPPSLAAGAALAGGENGLSCAEGGGA